jgi:ABC-type multidrug transport system permease subunit
MTETKKTRRPGVAMTIAALKTLGLFVGASILILIPGALIIAVLAVLFYFFTLMFYETAQEKERKQ